MKTIFNFPDISLQSNFPVLLGLTALLCLATIQTVGVDASLPLATAAAILVFCSRQSNPTTWDLLIHLYDVRTSQSARWWHWRFNRE